MKTENIKRISKETALATAKKSYTKPALKIYGAVSELTNGTTGSCYDVGGRHAKSGATWCG
jgi:hypothetical protein